MIQAKLPILHKRLEGDRLIKERSEIDISVDTSVFAEERWERHFPHNAARETLFAYVERIQEHHMLDRANVLTNLKALFCFIESDRITSFKEFCTLFDFADPAYFSELVGRMEWIFKTVLESSAVTPKN